MAKEEQIKTSIDLTGEKEYRAACTNINSSLREIGSEMKLTTAEFADNADSVEALTAKQKLLQKQFDEQAKKAEAAEKALKKMRDNGIEPTNPAYQKMQTNLNNTKADMVKIQKEIDDTSKKLKSSKVDWESVGETVGKAGKAIGAACAAMGAAIAAAGAAFFGLAEETREARENMGKLETSFTTAGHSAEDAKNTYTELYGVLGDDGQATEAAAHLAKLTTNEKELSDWTNICTGVYATFGDSLPIEGLTEAANETAKTGSITGNLADALNWAGVSEDDFQASLDACTSEQERQALITSTLNGLYSEAADKYREVNGDIIDAQKATANLNSAMAALGAIAEPIITKLKQLAAELLQEITPFVELIGKGLTGALSGAESAAEDFTDGLLGMVTFAIEKLTEMLPTFLEFAVKMIANIATGIAQSLPTLVPSLVQLVTDIVQVLIDNEFAVKMIANIATGIAQSLPTLVPSLVQLVTDIVQVLIDNIPLLIDAALQLVTGLAEGIINAIPVLVAALPQLITSLIDGLLSAIPQIIQAGIDLLTALITALPEIITTIVEAIPQIIEGIITALTENIPLIIQAGIDLLVALIQALPQIITTIVQAIPQIIQAGIDLLTALITALPEIITTIVEAIPQIIEGIITALTENIPLIIQAGIDLLVALIQALPQIITTIVQAIPQIISGIVNALIGNIDQIVMAGVQLFVALIQNLPTIIVEIVKAVPQIVSGIVQAFASLGGEMINAGENLLHGLWEGISGAASWLWEKVSGWASSLVSGIKDFFGIHSPSTVFAEIGGNMADGVGVGFTDNMGGVEGDMTAAMGGAGALTAAEAVNAVNNGIIANIEGLSGAVNAIVERVITGLTAQAQRFNQAGQDFDKNIASGMVAGIVQITQKVPQIAQSIITAFTAQHQKFVTEGTNIDKSIAQGMIAGIPQITGKVAQIIQPVITALRSYVSQFTEAGEEMVRGIWQGFQNMSGWLESRVRSMMRDIVAAVEEEMDINSPSKVFARIGSYMAQGLGEGFAREMRDVESSIRRETSNAVPEFRSGEGRDTRGGGTPSVEVVQNIYANETSYAEQQRQAARQFRQIAREVMA
jgi:phage-related protein